MIFNERKVSGMATEEIPMPEDPAPVMMSQEDYQKIADAMVTYKEIEMKYLAMRNSGVVARRVMTAYVIADLLLFAALWLSFTGWQDAAGWSILAFASEEALLATTTFMAAKLRAS